MIKRCVLMMILLKTLLGWCGQEKTPGNFVVYYGSEAEAAAFARFDLVVLDSGYSEIVEALKKGKKTVLAYLSLGEVNNTRDYFAEIKGKGLLLEKNPNWPDAFMVDIRKAEWRDYVLGVLIPLIIADGFDGIFIDTLDSSINQERVNARKFGGMTKAASDLVKQIRARYPRLKIMLNRAYEIGPEVACSIDYLLGESICGSYDFAEKKYIMNNEKAYEDEVKILKNIRKANPRLLIMTLDYCEPKDRARREAIRKKQKKNGFIPYVTTIGLDTISVMDDN